VAVNDFGTGAPGAQAPRSFCAYRTHTHDRKIVLQKKKHKSHDKYLLMDINGKNDTGQTDNDWGTIFCLTGHSKES